MGIKLCRALTNTITDYLNKSRIYEVTYNNIYKMISIRAILVKQKDVSPNDLNNTCLFEIPKVRTM